MQLLAVNYHYFRDEKPESGIYPISLREFENQVDELSKYYTFISQNELVEKIKKKHFDSKNYCLLTFDDGLKEQMNALKVLNRKGIPGVFYISSSPIKNGNTLNVHKLHYVRSVVSDIEIFDFIDENIDTRKVKFPENIKDLYRYDDLETKKLKYLLNFILEPRVRDKIIDDLFSSLILDESRFSIDFYMDLKDIKKIDSMGYLGTHCHAHLPLATLEPDGIFSDINSSLDFFKSDCGISKIKSISYPYGGPKAVSNTVSKISEDLNFTYGLTMFRGINGIDDFENPLMLKRVDTNDAPGGKSKNNEFCI